MRSLRLLHKQVQTIGAQVRDDAPHETCGILSGRDGVVHQIFPIANISATPEHHYEMDGNTLLNALKTIDLHNESFLAVYHSHPNGNPIPSQTDIRDASRNLPNVIHLIIGFRGNKARFQAWHINDGRVDKVELLIGNETSLQIAPLNHTQMIAILLATILAVVFLLIISVSLLPPAPPLPTP